MFEKIQDVLNEELKGKQFVYVSKYGSETRCEVKWITIVNSVSGDKDSLRKMKLGLNRMSPQKIKIEEKDKQSIEVPFKWWGHALKINVISTMGNVYELDKDNIYFIE